MSMQIGSKPGFTNPMTTGGDIIYGGASGLPTRLANGSAGQVLTSSGTTVAPTWGTAGNLLGVRSVTTTDTCTTADNVLLLSGASFTETLFNAATAGNAGRVLQLVHNGTSLTQSYTIATQAGQTVGGIASGSSVLYTNGEVLTLVSDGANWQILNHKTTTGWVSFSPSLSAGFGTTATSDFKWRRVGESLHFIGYWTNGTVAASIASFTLPGSLSVNTTAFNRGNTTAQNGMLVGRYGQNTSGNVGALITATGTDATKIYFGILSGANNLIAGNGNDFSVTGGLLSIVSDPIAISGFQP